MAQGQVETKNCLLACSSSDMRICSFIQYSETQTVANCAVYFSFYKPPVIKQENKNKDYVICRPIVYNNYDLELSRFFLFLFFSKLDFVFNIFKLDYLPEIMSGHCDLYWPYYKLL